MMLVHVLSNVNPGLMSTPFTAVELGRYHKKVSLLMTIGGIPPNFHKPWLINPGLTLRVLESQLLLVIALYALKARSHHSSRQNPIY